MKKTVMFLLLAILSLSVFFTASCSCNDGQTDDVDISRYSVVYPDAGVFHEKRLAEELAAAIDDKYGFELPVASDLSPKADYEICIGKTAHDSSFDPAFGADEYYVGKNGGSLSLRSQSASGIISAVRATAERLDDFVGADFSSVTQKSEDTSVCIMSYNLRVADANGVYGDRRARVAANILAVKPDSFGVQEATFAWITALKAALSSTYECVGTARDGKEGEASAVFYRKDKYDLIRTETKWLSDTPDVVGSCFEDSDGYIRIVTYALLRRKSDGLKYVHANTHLDLEDGARLKQIAVLDDVISPYKTYPTFVTGDFNDASDDNAAHYMETNGYRNSRFDAVVTDDHWTFPSPLYADDAGYEEANEKRIIDYCFVKGDHILANSYDVIESASADGGWSSDHYPIVADFNVYRPLSDETPEIESISIDDSFALRWGEDFSRLKLTVTAKVADGLLILDADEYTLDVPEGYAGLGTYTIKATLKSNPAVSDSVTVDITEAKLEAEKAELSSENGKTMVKTDSEYVWNEETEKFDDVGQIQYVGGIDNSATPQNGGKAGLKFTFNSSGGSFRLKIRCASTYVEDRGSSFGATRYITRDTPLNSVFKLTVNGRSSAVKAAVLPGFARGYSGSRSISRNFYLIDFADIPLISGENVVLLEGNADCGLANCWGETPVPNVDCLVFEAL